MIMMCVWSNNSPILACMELYPRKRKSLIVVVRYEDCLYMPYRFCVMHEGKERKKKEKSKIKIFMFDFLDSEKD